MAILFCGFRMAGRIATRESQVFAAADPNFNEKCDAPNESSFVLTIEIGKFHLNHYCAVQMNGKFVATKFCFCLGQWHN